MDEWLWEVLTNVGQGRRTAAVAHSGIRALQGSSQMHHVKRDSSQKEMDFLKSVQQSKRGEMKKEIQVYR